MKFPLTAGLVAAGALATAGPALAIDYPAPTDPGQVQKAPAGPHHTLKVGPHALGLDAEASAVESAIAGALAAGYRTGDIAVGGERRLGTKEMTAAIESLITSH